MGNNDHKDAGQASETVTSSPTEQAATLQTDNPADDRPDETAEGLADGTTESLPQAVNDNNATSSSETLNEEAESKGSQGSQPPVDGNALNTSAGSAPLSHAELLQKEAEVIQFVGKKTRYIFDTLSKENASAEETRDCLKELHSLRAKYTSMIRKQSNLDEKMRTVSSINSTIAPAMVQADVLRVVCLLINGDMANAIKKDIPHGEWVKKSKVLFPHLELRQLQNAMKLATIRNAALHCNLGVTKLIGLANIALAPEFNGADDPIGLVLETVSGNTSFLEDDHKLLAEIAVTNAKLQKNGLQIDLEVLRECIGIGESITNADIAEMLAMKEHHAKDSNAPSPTDFVRDIIKNEGKRVFALTGKEGGKRKAKTGETPSAIPDINSMFTKTRETILHAIENFDLKEAKVDRELYDSLMTELQKFGKKAFNS